MAFLFGAPFVVCGFGLLLVCGLVASLFVDCLCFSLFVCYLMLCFLLGCW